MSAPIPGLPPVPPPHPPASPATASGLTALPLFPLRTVLFPGGQLSLQIFEVRYLHMVRACQRQGTPFGVICLTSGGEVQKAGSADEQLYEVGTLAHIERLETVQAGLLHI